MDDKTQENRLQRTAKKYVDKNTWGPKEISNHNPKMCLLRLRVIGCPATVITP